MHPDFKVPVSYGPVTHGAIVAFKVEEKNGKFQLTPAWMSRDMDQAEPPVIANGVVFAYGSGENTRQAYPDKGLADFSPLRIKASTTRCSTRWMPRPARSCIPAAIRLRRSSISAVCRSPTDAYISARSTACCTASVFRAVNPRGS